MEHDEYLETNQLTKTIVCNMEIIIIQKISSEVKVEICGVFESNLHAN
jgi:hypothetical protein